MGPERGALCDNLELFARARRWKRYLHRRIRAYLHGVVLEVGAGMGAHTELLLGENVEGWLCLEPDPVLAARIPARLRGHPLADRCAVAIGTSRAVRTAPRFDAVLYLDVLEHIEDDRGELRRVSELLAPRGRVVVLAPAHQLLYSEYDAAIGHHRRYSKRTLCAIAPRELALERLVYLDSVGMLASLANRFLLRQDAPRAAQLATWDRVLIPLSAAVDPVLGYRLGKSLLGVWRRSG